MVNIFFPEGIPDGKIPLSAVDVQNFLTQANCVGDWSDVQSDEDFRSFLQVNDGVTVRNFLSKCLQHAGQVCTEDALYSLEKSDCIETVFECFSLAYAGGHQLQSQSTSVSAESIASQPVDSLITTERMNEIFSKGKGIPLTGEQVDYDEWRFIENHPLPAHKGVSILIKDDSLTIDHGQIALVNQETSKTVAIGHLEGGEREPRMVFATAAIDYEQMKENSDLYYLLLFSPDNAKLSVQDDVAAEKIEYYRLECSTGCEKPEHSRHPLCVDFGTSNTTAGSFGILQEGIEIVNFADVNEIESNGEPKMKTMFPTLVYVKSCVDKDNINYLFGYEARKQIIANHYEPNATVFHEIKCWFNDLDCEEDLYDEKKNKARVKREMIIKAYLQHVILLSEQYFGVSFDRIHFSAPVKLKEFFLQKLTAMFQGKYTVLRDTSSLDEGVAIVYEYIMERIGERPQEWTNGKILSPSIAGESEKLHEEKVSILDCGGGTTDLASCRYSYEELGDNTKKLNIYTTFTNGDPSFGGNNITYRILQLLKIKIAAAQREDYDDLMETIMNISEYEIMTKLDKNFAAKADIYKIFNERYAEAEKIIPTKFACTKRSGDKSKVRRNYYYLWQMAESIKIEFYKSSSTVDVDFNKSSDQEICISGVENYYLYIRQNGELVQCQKPLQHIRVTIKEINLLICPEIYSLLRTMLNVNKQEDLDKLTKVDYYKLSGQSCQIALFHDLLKEFIPGWRIRNGTPLEGASEGEMRQNSRDRLKMACLRGCINYLMNKEYGNIKPNMRIENTQMVYFIVEETDSGKHTLMMDASVMNLVKRPRTRRGMVLKVYDINKICRNTYEYDFLRDKHNRSECKEIQLSDLETEVEKSSNLSEAWRKSLLGWLPELHKSAGEATEDMVAVFLAPAKIGYGFLIYQLIIGHGAKDKPEYYICCDPKFVCYERMKSFFDGKR